MEMEICVSEWKMRIGDNKQKTIGGKYQVKMRLYFDSNRAYFTSCEFAYFAYFNTQLR